MLQRHAPWFDSENGMYTGSYLAAKTGHQSCCFDSMQESSKKVKNWKWTHCRVLQSKMAAIVFKLASNSSKPIIDSRFVPPRHCERRIPKDCRDFPKASNSSKRDNTGCQFLRSFKHTPDPGRTPTHVHFDKITTTAIKKRYAGGGGSRSGQ